MTQKVLAIFYIFDGLPDLNRRIDVSVMGDNVHWDAIEDGCTAALPLASR